jgi:protein-tyrosine sulfotransferase
MSEPETEPTEPGSPEARAEPILIHGILPRSGTNYLWDLVLLHPDCAAGLEPIREDLFLAHSDHLVAFGEAVREAWDPRWGNFGPELLPRLQASLGTALLAFVSTDAGRRLVTKNPSVRHLSRVFDFFPSARVIILVRDGRSVAQSCMDTFGWTFDRATRAWAEAAEDVERFTREQAARSGQWRLVRYEDLLDDLEGQVRSLLQFADLDPERYDFEAARHLPVRGSSVLFGPGRSSVNWDPVTKDASFAPKERWRAWTPQQLERFEWLAGAQSRTLGYEISPADHRSVAGRARHAALDLRWRLERSALSARAALGSASRPLRRRLGLVR